MVPIGATIFTIAIAIDTIGHRTIYKDVLRGGEQLVHHITIVMGIASCVLLVLAFDHPSLWIPAMVCTVMSFVYSLIDEVFHWRRYVSLHSDTVEMWSHVGIFVGHGIMMLGWWRFYSARLSRRARDARGRGAPWTALPAGKRVEVFYDGDCPLCMREIRMLMRKDARPRSSSPTSRPRASTRRASARPT